MVTRYPFVFIFLYLIFKITLWWFSSQHCQYIFPSISDNNYFYFSISFFIRILSALNHNSYISILYGGISRLLLVLLPLCALCFYWTAKISSFPLSLPTLRTLSFIPNFWTKRKPFYSKKFHWVIIQPQLSNHKPDFFLVCNKTWIIYGRFFFNRFCTQKFYLI